MGSKILVFVIILIFLKSRAYVYGNLVMQEYLHSRKKSKEVREKKREMETYLKICGRFLAFCAALFFLLFFIIISGCSAHSGRVDLGYISDSSGVANSIFSTEVKVDGDKLSAEFSGKVRYQETKGEDSADILSTIQTNYNINEWLWFFNVEYCQDKINGIDGQVDTGAGVGYQITPDFRIQSGLYRRFSDDGEFLNKTTADYSRVIYGPISFQEKASYEVNMRRGSDNLFTVVTNLKTKLVQKSESSFASQIFLKVSLDYSRNNDPEEGYPKDVRKWETTIGVEF